MNWALAKRFGLDAATPEVLFVVLANANRSAFCDAIEAETVTRKGQPGGYAGLDAQGKLASAVMPVIPQHAFYLVSSEAAMLTLACDAFDVAIRTDLDNQRFQLMGTDPAVLANWAPWIAGSDPTKADAGTVAALVQALAGKQDALATVPELAGQYGAGNQIPKITVGANGVITAVELVDVQGASGGSEGNLPPVALAGVNLLAAEHNDRLLVYSGDGNMLLLVPPGLPEGFRCMMVALGAGNVLFAATNDGPTIVPRSGLCGNAVSPNTPAQFTLVSGTVMLVDAASLTSAELPPLTAPADLTAAAQGALRVALSWTYLFGSDWMMQFRVYRSMDGGMLWDEAGTTSCYSWDAQPLVFVNDGLSPEATYTYKIVPFNSGGEGAASGTASATTETVPNYAPTIIRPPPEIPGLVSYVSADPGLMTVDEMGGVQELADYANTQSFMPPTASQAPGFVNGEVIFDQASMRYLRDTTVPTTDNCTFVMIGRQLAIPSIGDEYGPLMGSGSGQVGTSRQFSVDSLGQFVGASVGEDIPPLPALPAAFNLTDKAFYFAAFDGIAISIEHAGNTAAGSGYCYEAPQNGLYLGAYRRQDLYSFAHLIANFAMTAALYFDHALTPEEITDLKAWVSANWPDVLLA